MSAMNCALPEAKSAVTLILADWNWSLVSEHNAGFFQSVTLRRVVSETKIWTLLGVHIWKVVVLASRWTGVRVEEVIVTLTRPLLGSVEVMSTVTEEQSAGVEEGEGRGRRKKGRDKRGERRR